MALLFILLQASAYWLLARSWVQVRSMPPWIARIFRGLRVVNVAVLVVCAIVIALNLPPNPGLIVLTIGVWIFAVVEYLNYYVVRLAYPATRWFGLVTQWRTPRLMLDVASAL